MPRKTGLCRVCVQPYPLRRDNSIGWHRDGETACEGSRLPAMIHGFPPGLRECRDVTVVPSAPWLTDGRIRRRLRAIVVQTFDHQGVQTLHVAAHYETPAGSLLADMPADDWFRWAADAWAEGARS